MAAWVVPAMIAVSAAATAYSASQAGKAGQAGVAASKFASDLQYQMYQEGREDVKPWRDAGAWALGELTGTPGKPIYGPEPTRTQGQGGQRGGGLSASDQVKKDQQMSSYMPGDTSAYDTLLGYITGSSAGGTATSGGTAGPLSYGYDG